MSLLPATQHAVPLNNGNRIPQLGFGTWQAPPGEVRKAVEVAIKAGFRHIDGAAIYCNEAEVGEAIAACIAEGVVSRGDLFVTTKLWNMHHAPEDVEQACRASLARLKLDYIDLYLVHWPSSIRNDAKCFDAVRSQLLPFGADGKLPIVDIPLTETWKAMEALVDAKLCVSIGVSNCSPAQLQAVLAAARIRPAAHQIECHPALPQTELRQLHAEHGIVTQAYCPLGIGMEDVSKSLLKHPRVEAIAAEAGMPAASMLLRWNITVGNVTLSKSVTPERIAENAATPVAPLPPTVMQQLNEFGAANPLRTCNPNFITADGAPFFPDGLPKNYA